MRARYFRIRSWHITDQRRHDSPWRSLCGQQVRHTSEIAETLDLREKSCESCLRYARARKE